MKRLVFRLNHAPPDEADGVRDVLEANGIEFYETDAGRWGFSMAGIWVTHADDYDRAREVIESFQAEHTERIRSEYAEAKRNGEVETVFSRFRRNPGAILFLVAFVLFILYVSLMPFIDLGG